MDILIDSATMMALNKRNLIPSFRQYLAEHYNFRTPITTFDQSSVLVLASSQIPQHKSEATDLAKKHFCEITSGQQPLPKDPNKKLLAKACFLAPEEKEFQGRILNRDCSVYICDESFFNDLEARYKPVIANSNQPLRRFAVSV